MVPKVAVLQYKQALTTDRERSSQHKYFSWGKISVQPVEDAWVYQATAALVRSYEKRKAGLVPGGLFFMRVVNQVTFDAYNIPVIYNITLLLFFF